MIQLLSLNCNRFRDEEVLEWLQQYSSNTCDIICLQEADMDIINPANYGKVFTVDANHQYISGRYNHRDGMNALYNDGHAKWVDDENGVLAKAIADWDDFFAIVDQ